MENFKFTIFSIIILIVLALVGYWAFFTMESGSVHVEREKEQQLTEENELLREEVARLKSELEQYVGVEDELIIENEEEISTEEENENISATPLKYQSLINELNELIKDNITMKEKSRGTRVGTVQNFLNIYNGTSKKIDNDYGAGTKADMIKFQKAEGLTGDGEAGPSTFTKMVEWLKKQ